MPQRKSKTRSKLISPGLLKRRKNTTRQAQRVAGVTPGCKRRPSKAEDEFAAFCDEHGFTGYVREYKVSSPDHMSPKPFKRKRSYRIDFAWPQYMIAVEWDGAIFKGWRGAHTSPKTFASDRIKDVLLQEAGWLVMRFNVIHKRDGLIGPLMMMAFVARGWGRDARSCQEN